MLYEDYTNLQYNYFYPYINYYPEIYEDCKTQETRRNNYYKQCFGPVYACKDACYDPFTNYYRPVGPWKTCGICVGYQFLNIQPPLCCVYWDGRGYFKECAINGCPITSENNSVLWNSYHVPSCKDCEE